MMQLKSAEVLRIEEGVLDLTEGQKVGCSLYNEVLELCLEGLN